MWRMRMRLTERNLWFNSVTYHLYSEIGKCALLCYRRCAVLRAQCHLAYGVLHSNLNLAPMSKFRVMDRTEVTCLPLLPFRRQDAGIQ